MSYLSNLCPMTARLKIRPKYNLIVSRANCFYFENSLMRLRLFSDIGHVMTKIDKEGICTSSRRKLKCACTLLGLKI